MVCGTELHLTSWLNKQYSFFFLKSEQKHGSKKKKKLVQELKGKRPGWVGLRLGMGNSSESEEGILLPGAWENGVLTHNYVESKNMLRKVNTWKEF